MFGIFAGVISLCAVGQSVFTKIASTKNDEASSMRFNAWKISASLLLFLLFSFYKLQFHMPTVVFSSVYGLALFFSTLFGYKALSSGSMALSSLIVSYSVVIPCLFGIIFLNESVNFIKILGFIFLLLSMYLLNRQKEDLKINKCWLVYVLTTFLSNGICSVVQKMHQTLYPASFCNEFMICSLLLTFIMFFVISMGKKYTDKKSGTTKYALLAGILMGLGNYITLLLSSRVDASVMFPVITILSMLFNVTVSKLYFKDSFSIIQFAGIILGVFSVLFIK
ncbi:MAG: EamA family transporter [Clostridia bacterium]|nr:EamA family transporter [Clostridia bacterium]